MAYSDLTTFYRSKEWIDLRSLIIMERTNEDGELLCEYSGLPIAHKYDAVVHHKIPLTEENVFDANIALNPDNLMVVSFRSHNEIHERFGFEMRRVYLVYGSPCAGKTTWVRNVANDSDIIMDIDAIYSAVSVSNAKQKRLARNVFMIRDCILDQIKTRYGNFKSAYIIGGYPMVMERKRFYDLYGAEPIFIDTPYDVCMERAEKKPDGWKGYVDEWWERYQPDA